MSIDKLEQLARLVRTFILKATTRAGSGHPTSSLSATELMIGLVFGGTFRYAPDQPDHPNNDRLIFSKGHASPLFYALWLAAGRISEQTMMTYRQFGSRLEGHPTVRFPYTEAATGSLGQGLSIGVGDALAAKYLDKLPYRTWVLLGDSEMAEGSVWEAIQLASHYELNNLVGLLDMNRLGQRGQTMDGWDVETYRRRVEAFGWEALCIDGHAFDQVLGACRQATESTRPVMIIAKTVKGKGVSLVENKDGWHGKALDEDQLKEALDEIGEVDTSVRGTIAPPEDLRPARDTPEPVEPVNHDKGTMLATRDGYGLALKRLYPRFPNLVSLDGEVSNSTRAEKFKDACPQRFFEMYIAEQNMVGAALGLAMRGKAPFVSSFAAFLGRAFDQVRMAQYSRPNLKLVGSHAGVSIGQDGPSQMGLEDMAMFRVLCDSVVLYPCDAVSTEKLVEVLADHDGLAYLRTTRMKTPVIYDNDETFRIGGCNVLRRSDDDVATVVAAGVTLHEALAAHDMLADRGIAIRVVDLYSVKPLDLETLSEAARQTGCIVTVEDHYRAGGLGEAVAAALSDRDEPVYVMAVDKMPRSGQPEELLRYEGIDREAIVTKILDLVAP